MSDAMKRRHFVLKGALIFFNAGAFIIPRLNFASNSNLICNGANLDIDDMDLNFDKKEKRMDSKTKRDLTAPCGLDCFNCEIYEKNITEEMKVQFASKIQKDPEEIPCKGCRMEEGCRHLGLPCETMKCIVDKGLEFCFECDEFPCVKLQPAKDGADRFPHNFKLFNLCRIKAVGVEKWAEDEAALIRRRYYSGKFIPGTGPVLERQ